MKNWKTNIGGALSATGTSLLALGILPQLSQISPTTSNVLTPHQLAALWYVALAGFILSGLGKGLTALFAADASQVKELTDRVSTVEETKKDK